MNPYLLAAELIDLNCVTHSCDAINRVTSNHQPYCQIFCPSILIDNVGVYWLFEANRKGLIKLEEMREWRVTALCLAAAMYEAGDLKLYEVGDLK